MIHQLTEDTIGVTVPENGFNPTPFGGKFVDEIRYNTMPSPGKFKGASIKLPPGNWDIIGKASGLEEIHWLVILLDEPIEYLDGSQFYDATKSGLSMLRKHNLNPDTTIILKKQP